MNDADAEFLKEIVELRFRSTDRALKIAAAELSRRLDILNHAHEQATAERAVYVRREVLDSKIERIEERIVALEKLAAIAVFLAVALPVAIRFVKP
jgi:hypothetical protein